MRYLLCHLPVLLAIGLGAYGLTSFLTGGGQDRLETALHAAEQAARMEAALLGRLAGVDPGQAGTALPADVIWPGTDRATIGLAMQQTLVEAAGEAGVTLLSFGLGTAEPDVALPGTAFDLELEGGHQEVAAFLNKIEAARPPLAVSYLWARPLPADPSRPVAPVSLRLTVWGFGGRDREAP